MMKKLDFKGKIRYFNYKSEQGLLVKPLRDWKFLFCFFIVLTIIFLLAGIYLFWKFQKELDSKIGLEAVQNEKMITVDRKSLQNVLKEIGEKALRFEKNLSAPSIKDPSI